MSTTEIIVTQQGDEISISIDGDVRTFDSGVKLAVEFARLYLRHAQMNDAIQRHIKWLGSRTITQVNGLTPTTLSLIAESLRDNSGLTE